MIGRDKQDSLRSGLIAATVLLGSLACAKVAQCVVESRRVGRFADYATAQGDPDPNAAQPWLASAKDVAQTLREKNLFVKMPPRKHPVQQVDGILGREVLIGNKWYKAGDRVGEAKIVSVDSTHVIIEWNGQNKTFAPIAAANAEPGPTPTQRVVKPKMPRSEAPKAAAEGGGTNVTAAETATVEGPFAWLGIDLPRHVMAKFLEMWNGMPEEQRQKAKEKWNTLSDEEKQEAIRGLEERT